MGFCERDWGNGVPRHTAVASIKVKPVPPYGLATLRAEIQECTTVQGAGIHEGEFPEQSRKSGFAQAKRADLRSSRSESIRFAKPLRISDVLEPSVRDRCHHQASFNGICPLAGNRSNCRYILFM